VILLLLAKVSKKIQFQQYLLWLGLALVALIIAGLVVAWLRRRVLGSQSQRADAGLFDELRAMRDRGEMSAEEYDTAKAAMVAKLSGKTAPPRTKPPPSDQVAKPGFDLTGAPLPPRQPPGV
jgi:hypothetical protein